MVDKRGLKGAPDLVVEILSPSTRRLDLDLKKRAYTERGVEEYWIVSPEKREIQVHRLQEPTGAIIYSDHETITTPILPGFTLALQELFV
jgi:Uma2 family endonuclease